MREFSFEPTDYPLNELPDEYSAEALRGSLNHLKYQSGLPEEFMYLLLMVEFNCRVHNGQMEPLVQVDDTTTAYVMPPNMVPIDFLIECLRRHSADHVHCCMIVDHHLIVGYVSESVLWSASCPLEYQGNRVGLGDWSVNKECGFQGDPDRGQVRLGRNAPCSCGSGKKYNKCCGRRRRRLSSHGADDTLNEATFACQLISAIRNAHPTAQVTYDPDSAYLLNDGQPFLSIVDLFWEYSAAPTWHRCNVLEKCVRVWSNITRPLPESWEDARPDVLPRIYARAEYEHVKVPDADRRVYRIVADHFAVALVYDHRDTMEMIYSDDLAAWGVSEEVAFHAALQNLREMSLHPQFSMHLSGVFAAEYQDDYDSSRVLWPDIIAAANVVGDPVVLIPNRRTLFISGANDSGALCVMADLALKCTQQPWHISGIAMRFHDGRWQPYQPPYNHPARARFRNLYLHSMHRAYAEQCAILGTTTERNGTTCFVSSYLVWPELGHERAFSNTVWSNGLDSLLPRVDVMTVIVDPPSRRELDTKGADACDSCEILAIKWEDMCTVLGDLMTKTSEYPDRYLIRGVCDSTKMDTLRARSLAIEDLMEPPGHTRPLTN